MEKSVIPVQIQFEKPTTCTTLLVYHLARHIYYVFMLNLEEFGVTGSILLNLPQVSIFLSGLFVLPIPLNQELKEYNIRSIIILIRTQFYMNTINQIFFWWFILLIVSKF